MGKRISNFLERINFSTQESKNKLFYDDIKVKVCMPDYEEKVFNFKESEIEFNLFEETSISQKNSDKARKGLEYFLEDLSSKIKRYEPKKVIFFFGAGIEWHIVPLAKELLENTRSNSIKEIKIRNFIISCFVASMGDDEIYKILRNWVDKHQNHDPVLYTENFTRGFGPCSDSRINYLSHNEARIKGKTLFLELGFLDHKVIKRKLIKEVKQANVICMFGVGNYFLTESTIINGLISMCEQPKPQEKLEKVLFINDYRGESYPIMQQLQKYAEKNLITLRTPTTGV